ncbi:hypothetical protein CHS0354_013490 [Potamilus streckersoni]|uniref:Uncharacterized protein n=1 Tax=Potamilus streckersoni TaxID=2493646 RepID=A0AAE0T9J1_9BIVA|nr:hypothetical protein CHS0354_013490 [Potamilus streckersoni]
MPKDSVPHQSTCTGHSLRLCAARCLSCKRTPFCIHRIRHLRSSFGSHRDWVAEAVKQDIVPRDLISIVAVQEVLLTGVLSSEPIWKIPKADENVAVELDCVFQIHPTPPPIVYIHTMQVAYNPLVLGASNAVNVIAFSSAKQSKTSWYDWALSLDYVRVAGWTVEDENEYNSESPGDLKKNVLPVRSRPEML